MTVACRSRSFAAFQFRQHRELMANLATEIAALEGQLMAQMGLPLEEMRGLVYGPDYLEPMERRAALVKAMETA